MRRYLVFALLPVVLGFLCHEPPPPTEPAAQWREIEARYPQFADGYRLQQAALADAYAGIVRALTDTARRIDTTQVAKLDMCRWLERRGIVGLNCPRSDTTDVVVDRPSIRECWNRFMRCENAGVPADCDAQWRRCIGTRP